MPSYRTRAYDALRHGLVTLSPTRGEAIQKELADAATRYEHLLEESAMYAFTDAFRVTVFGSARGSTPENPDFRFISHLTRRLGEEMNVTVVTGGGPGMMLAANFGLSEAIDEAKARHKKVDDQNIGIMVDLPFETKPNACLDVYEKFENFSTRLEEFIRLSHGIYLAPGGWGTDLEAAMFLQLKQLDKLEPGFPIVAHPFWQPIFERAGLAMYDERKHNGMPELIGPEDKQLVHFTADVEEAVKIFKRAHARWETLKKNVRYTKEKTTTKQN